MKNYEVEVITRKKILRYEIDTLKEAMDYLNSFKDDGDIISIEVTDLETNEVVGRVK